MTYVTCPILRYHPAVVAQKAATMQLLSDGRFTLGLGAGENLNEHIVGGKWPVVGVRHEMLEEAVEIIRALWAGDAVTHRGKHFDVESAKVWDLPESPPPIGVAVSGPRSCRVVGRGEAAHRSDRVVVRSRSAACSEASDRSVPLVHRQLEGERRAAGSRVVRRRVEDRARRRRVEPDALRPDVEEHVAGIRRFETAGFTHVALVQVGGNTQEQFVTWAATELLPALRS